MFSFIISLAYAIPQILLHILDVRNEHFQLIHRLCENSVQRIVHNRRTLLRGRDFEYYHFARVLHFKLLAHRSSVFGCLWLSRICNKICGIAYAREIIKENIQRFAYKPLTTLQCLKPECDHIRSRNDASSIYFVIKNYLTKRKQRVKINGSYSTYRDVRVGVPQGSVLGPLLFNIFINDIFLFVKNTSVCNYADDTTIYACNSDIDIIINRLETDSSILTKWFSENYMKLNEEKCHFMIFGNKSKESVVTIGKSTIKESEHEKLLGVTFDKKLSFTKHVQDLCKRQTKNCMRLPGYLII